MSTGQAAKAVGISRATLQEWIRSGKFKAPKTRLVGGMAVRHWSESDISRLRAIRAKIYYKGRGRPPKKGKKVKFRAED